METVAWESGSWTTAPVSSSIVEGALAVEAAEGSDAWLRTAYGFVHDTEHALLAPLTVGEAMEVRCRGDFTGEFDQAGLFVRADAETWVKAGVEFADGHLGLGAVVTNGASDWSVGLADEWAGRELVLRVSRWADALIIRARASEDTDWRLVRLAPFPGDVAVSAGPFVAAPTRTGLVVTFASWTRGPADLEIH
ncbi:DUF1349 domain-containing protein [Microbacterium sp. ZW T5_56]|uniref:DUF1349 domain-containing protein n=1 Tax=Microbacterium sp. ZW T5_56 TaxID=3378081 RepID=UPI003852C9B5